MITARIEVDGDAYATIKIDGEEIQVDTAKRNWRWNTRIPIGQIHSPLMKFIGIIREIPGIQLISMHNATTLDPCKPLKGD